MPMRVARACQEPLCPNYAEPETWQCAFHKAKSQAQHDADSNARRARYGRGWDRFVDALKLNGNSLCQFVDQDRMRCHRPAEISHHLLSAEKFPMFLLDWRNVVRVCRAHHPNSPDDPGEAEYYPTIWPIMLGGAPVPEWDGGRVPTDVALWTLQRQRRILGY